MHGGGLRKGSSGAPRGGPCRRGEDMLKQRIEEQVRQRKQAEQDRFTWLRQSAYLGVLGLVFVLPVVGGAYLGRWLDSLAGGYSARWTVSLILLGVAVGAYNVYYLIRSRE
jgi:ATP synthase protein I